MIQVHTFAESKSPDGTALFLIFGIDCRIGLIQFRGDRDRNITARLQQAALRMGIELGAIGHRICPIRIDFHSI